MRRFAILGPTARADAGFLLNDVAGTSGRLDVLLRCVRAAMLASHGLRPDERALAVLLQKVLAADADDGFAEVRPGIAMTRGGLAEVLADSRGARSFVLDEGAPDIRSIPFDAADLLFVIGGHRGIPDADRALLQGAQPIGIGPVSIHADDVTAVVVNELDRQGR